MMMKKKSREVLSYTSTPLHLFLPNFFSFQKYPFLVLPFTLFFFFLKSLICYLSYSPSATHPTPLSHFYFLSSLVISLFLIPHFGLISDPGWCFFWMNLYMIDSFIWMYIVLCILWTFVLIYTVCDACSMKNEENHEGHNRNGIFVGQSMYTRWWIWLRSTKYPFSLWSIPFFLWSLDFCIDFFRLLIKFFVRFI